MFTRRLLPLLLVILIAASAAGCGDDGSGSSSDSNSETTTSTEQTTENETNEPGSTDEKCSATGLDVEYAVDSSFPAPVEQTRRTLFDAALACDYDALGAVALQSPDFGFTYGGETDPIAYWRKVDGEQRTLERLARLLSGSHVVRTDEGPRYYAWPSVHQNAPKPADWDDLRATGAYPDAQVAAFEREGSYLGYRISIQPDGTWGFFLTGD